MHSKINYLLISIVLIFSLGLFVACGGGSGGSSINVEDVSIQGQVTTDAVEVAVRSQGLLQRLEIIPEAQAQDSDSTPVVGATVDLLDESGTIIDSTITDENGEFQFLNVVAGNYSIQVNDSSITEPLLIDNVIVLDGDTTVVRGEVTEDGGVISVEYEVASCGSVSDNQAQLGHATNVAEAAEVSVDEVIALREGSCLGWGEIAQAFEVPPGTLGLGNNGVRGGGRPENAGPPDDRGMGNGNNGNGNGGNGNGGDDDDDDGEN